MGDWHRNDLDFEDLDHEENKNEKEFGYEAFRENIIFLIDASAPMHEVPANEDTAVEVFRGKSWFEQAVIVAREVMKARIVQAEHDRIAVVLYGTEARRNDSNFDHIYCLQDLEELDAEPVTRLQHLSKEGLQQVAGRPQPVNPNHLRWGLWTASALLSKLAGGSAAAVAGGGGRAHNQVWVFTNNEHPEGHGEDVAGARDNILSRCTELREAGAFIQLYPMMPVSRAEQAEGPPAGTRDGVAFRRSGWDMSFWAEALALKGGGGVGGSEEGAVAALESYQGTRPVENLRSLVDVLRRRGHKKRLMGRVRWALSDDFELALQLYSLTMAAKEAKTQRVTTDTNQPVKFTSAYINLDTGDLLSEPPDLVFPKPSDKAPPANRFPQLVFKKEEVQELRRMQPQGLRLLGFKPVSCLAPYHQLRSSTFAYPDERSRPGSTTAFIALHQAMVREERMAVCSLARLVSSDPRLVAVVPQEEVLDANGDQLHPPGFNLAYLPYVDDLRDPERDASFVGTNPERASEDQVEAAAALVDAMQLEEEWASDNTPNPHLQLHWRVLEALAMDQEPPRDLPPEAFDASLPHKLSGGAIERSSDAVLGFKAAVYGEGYELDVRPAAKAATGAKRKAEAMAAMNPEQLEQLRQLAASGGLTACKNDQLKEYCSALGIPKSGNKAELVARIEASLQQQQQQQHGK